jgi:hypothetical protein
MRTWLVLLSAFLLQCGDEEKTDPLSSANGFCTEWAKRACSVNVQNQCASNSEEDCVLAQTDFCQALVPSALYSKPGAKACLDYVEDAYVDAQLTGEERDVVRNLASPCDVVLSGDGQKGDSCNENSDCDRVAGFECVIKTPDDPGTCQVPNRVGGGLPCDGAADVCADGFYCTDDEYCLVRKNAGDTCSESEPCARGLNCRVDQDAGVGECVAKLEQGDEGCDVDADCETGICAAGEDDDPNLCARVILLDAPKSICRDFR